MQWICDCARRENWPEEQIHALVVIAGMMHEESSAIIDFAKGLESNVDDKTTGHS